jgi:hypothetical protein
MSAPRSLSGGKADIEKAALNKGVSQVPALASFLSPADSLPRSGLVQRGLCDVSGMATEPYSPNPRSELSVLACGWACSMTKSRSQELSEKADAERRRCCDWLLPFMQNGQPKFLTKDELRVAAMHQLMSRKAHSTSRGSMLSRQPAARLVRTLAPTAAHQNLATSLSAYSQPRPATPCGYRRSRAMSPIGGKAEKMRSI